MPNPLVAPFMRWVGRLSFPRLFALFAVLFVVNLVVPDPIPFIDEVLLGVGALVFAAWKDRRKPGSEPIDHR